MRNDDARELDLIRAGVNCAAVLEALPPTWRLDKRESTRRAWKYRRGKGEILIVNHDGKGWWDPLGPAKGDVFDLVRHLDPHLGFGAVRKVLRGFVGVIPSFPEIRRTRRGGDVPRPVPERWAARRELRPGSPAWRYLVERRCIPPAVLFRAAAQDSVREGWRGSAWFAHRDGGGLVTHVEARGPDFRGSLAGGIKTLFRFGASLGTATRLALAEAPIDALSLAAFEEMRPDTLYAATGGGMGPGTVGEIEAVLRVLRASPGALLASAADLGEGGERHAERHKQLAASAGVPFARLLPTKGKDWNDVIVLGGTP